MRDSVPGRAVVRRFYRLEVAVETYPLVGAIRVTLSTRNNNLSCRIACLGFFLAYPSRVGFGSVINTNTMHCRLLVWAIWVITAYRLIVGVYNPK